MTRKPRPQDDPYYHLRLRTFAAKERDRKIRNFSFVAGPAVIVLLFVGITSLGGEDGSTDDKASGTRQTSKPTKSVTAQADSAAEAERTKDAEAAAAAKKKAAAALAFKKKQAAAKARAVRGAKAKAAAAAKRRQAAAAAQTDPQFGTCGEANDAGYGDYSSSDPEYAWYDDRDSDGMVCEQ